MLFVVFEVEVLKKWTQKVVVPICYLIQFPCDHRTGLLVDLRSVREQEAVSVRLFAFVAGGGGPGGKRFFVRPPEHAVAMCRGLIVPLFMLIFIIRTERNMTLCQLPR